MSTHAMLRMVLMDERLTHGLGDEEARLLVEWLTDWLESPHAPQDWPTFQRRWGRARTAAKFVWLWCYCHSRGAAAQLTAAENLEWPFPAADADPAEVMQEILDWEGDGTTAASQAA